MLPEVALYLRVDSDTIENLERAGKVPVARRHGRRRIYNEKEFFELYYYFYHTLLEQCQNDVEM